MLGGVVATVARLWPDTLRDIATTPPERAHVRHARREPVPWVQRRALGPPVAGKRARSGEARKVSQRRATCDAPDKLCRSYRDGGSHGDSL